ncbi:unnamed protein product, partial [Owenia fusiformis]
INMAVSDKNISSGLIAAGVAAAFHPIVYAKILIQVGHEPLRPTLTKTLLGKEVLMYPNAFKYVNEIRRQDGFFGLYRGLTAKIAGSVVGNFVSVTIQQKFFAKVEADDIAEEIEEDEDPLKTVKKFCVETSQEMVCRCAGVIASQPFHVIMVRTMSQFVGRENTYSNIFSSFREVYDSDGILGFFKGLVPRLLGEIISIWLANVLTHLINTYAFKDNKEIQSYTQAACGLGVTHLTYPFTLVSTVMAVTNSGLAAGSPPTMAHFSSWTDCWSFLSTQGELKRGSSMFWRYTPVPKLS